MYPNDPPILGGAFDYHDREQLEAMYSWAGSSCALSEWLSGQGISVDPNTLNKWRRRFGIEIARAVYRHRSDALKAPTSDQDRHLIDLEKARLRVEHAETQLRILSKETARNELLADSLREAVRALPSITVSPPAYTKAQRMSPVTQVVHVSDWHYGEVVDSRQTGGANQYNAEIACRRLAQLERLILKARDIISHAHAVPRLRVFLLGDMASGSIHDLPETNELNVYEQWASGALVLSQFLQRLASQYKEVVVEGVPGNHGRMSERKRAKDRYVNWDYLIYQTIGLMLARQKNLTCRFPMDPFMLTEVEGFRYLLYHGDEIKCFPPDSLVTLPDLSQSPIGQLQEGDRVLNRQGLPTRVVAVHRYPSPGELVTFQVSHLPGSAFRCTPTHRVLAVKGQEIRPQRPVPEPDWTEARYLSPGDYLAVPKRKIAAENTSLDTGPCKPPLHARVRYLPPELPIDEDLGLLLGWYAGDGSISAQHCIEVCFAGTEGVWAERYADIIEKFTGLRPHFVKRERFIRAILYHKHLASMLHHLVPGKSADRGLHESVLGWPREALRGLLVGWLAADGTARTERNGYCYVTGSSTSGLLARQMFWVAVSLGYHPSLRQFSKQLSGHARIQWQVVFYDDDARELAATTRVTFRPVKKPLRSHDLRQWRETSEYYLVRIASAIREDYTGEVVDLTVEGDASFLVNMLAVHNSWMGIPWYGIDRAVARLRELFLAQHEIFEYVALAHFHQQAEMARALGKVLLNGSIVGGSEYSMGVLFVSSAPQQRVYFVHPEHGISWQLSNDLSLGDVLPHPYVIAQGAGETLAEMAKTVL